MCSTMTGVNCAAEGESEGESEDDHPDEFRNRMVSRE